MKNLFIVAVMLFIFMANEAIANANRIISLDFCADQYVMQLLPESRILAVSIDADKYFSYMRDHAANLAKVRPIAEDVITLNPDLIIRSYGGGPYANQLFEKAGIPVLQIPFINSIEEIKSTIRNISRHLSVEKKGEKIISDMNRRLNDIKKSDPEKIALYMTSSGVTSGSGTLIDEMLQKAHLKNFHKRPGWSSIPLERLAYEQPSLIAASFFNEKNNPFMWSAMRHPVAKKQMLNHPTVMLQGAWTACAGSYLVDAIEALSRGGTLNY